MPKRAFVPPSHPDTRQDQQSAAPAEQQPAQAVAAQDTSMDEAVTRRAGPAHPVGDPTPPSGMQTVRTGSGGPRQGPGNAGQQTFPAFFSNSPGPAMQSPPPPVLQKAQPLQPGGPPPAAPAPGDDASGAGLPDFTIVRPRSDTPTSGWRRAVYAMTGGVVNPGIGAAEQRRHERIGRIHRPLNGSHFIAVTSLKGGVGKSTITAMLGLMLAEYRGDRVVSMDANPDAGTLADRLTGDSGRSVRDLLDNIDGIRALPDVARYTSLIGRLQVVASEQDPANDAEFDRVGYERVCGVLSRFYDIVITDSGTGVLHSAMEATLLRANSLVVVGSPTVDGASRASKTLDWLVAHGFREAVARSVVVLSGDRTSRSVDEDRLRAHFAKRCRAVVEIPRDPHLAAGGRIQPNVLRPATSDAFLELAALVADEFGSPRPLRSS